MKRALLISFAAHIGLIGALSQLTGTSSPQPMRGYPRMVMATLIEKSVAVQTSTGQQPAVLAPAAKPVPSTRAVEKKRVTTKPSPPSPAPPQPASPSSAAKAAPAGTALKIDAPEFPFPHYLMLVQMRIEANWQPPFSGIGHEATTVYFKITSAGEIGDVKVEKSSGNFGLDQAAVRAVYSANPLPPLPSGFGLHTLGVHFEFVAN